MKTAAWRKPAGAVAGRMLPSALAGALLLGGAAAWWLVVPRAAAGRGQSSPNCPSRQQATVLRQWYYASQIGTEEAWQSVIDYFPEKKYISLARQAATGPDLPARGQL